MYYLNGSFKKYTVLQYINPAMFLNRNFSLKVNKMKRLNLFLISLFFLSPGFVSAQKITYSEFNREDSEDNTKFEILGKADNTFIIYKNIGWKHILAIYDNDMHIIKSNRISFIPDKTFNIDFITYPGFFYMIYQYQKKNTVYCKMAKISNKGEKIGEPVELDTTRIPVSADNKIYNTIYSEDKQKIMLYKQQRKNERLTITTKLFDTSMHMLDSTRQVFPFDQRRNEFTDLLLDNEGNFVFAKESRIGSRDNISELDIITRKPGVDSFTNHYIELSDKFIDDVKIKIDNLNKHYVINSFYYSKPQGSIEGLFTAIMPKTLHQPTIRVFNIFDDSLRVKINTDGQYRFAFDNLFLKNIIIKKDGGFILMAENYYTQNRDNSNYNRSDYLYNSPYTSSYDYYLYNPSSYGYYRPLSSFNSIQTVRYYYDNILLLSMDSTLKILWKNIIHKQQYDDDNDNFLSFATMNSGSEIHFLFMGDDRRNQIMYDHSVLPNGLMKRYATLKSREVGYEFMPRLAKQVGANQVIVPCVYRSYIAFAKVDF